MAEGSRADLRSILAGPVVEAARGLLGTLLVCDDAVTQRTGRIVEVEAYAGPDDLASHARFGRTARNATMFGRAGLAYVYGVYGMHTCLNVVCGAEGLPAAVLVRAAEPVSGAAAMRAARITRSVATRRLDRASPAAAEARVAALAEARLASGPGNLGAAFSIGQEDDGCDLLAAASRLRLEHDPARQDRPTASGPRIGVAYAGLDWGQRPWRFWIVDSRAVSGRNVA